MEGSPSILERFGLSPDEATVYQTVLALGHPKVTQIAQKISKQRTATYFHIKKLVERGFLREAQVDRHFEYIATPPKELAATFDRWTTDFKSLVPQLEALQTIEKEVPVVEIKESKQGYYNIYDEISSLPEGSSFRVIEGKEALADELTLLSDKEWSTFFQRIIDRNITTRGVFTEESLALPSAKLSEANQQLLKKRRWEVRILPEASLPMQKLLFIYANTIAFLFPETSLVVTIKHKGIAQVMAAMFDGLFAAGKPRTPAW